ITASHAGGGTFPNGIPSLLAALEEAGTAVNQRILRACAMMRHEVSHLCRDRRVAQGSRMPEVLQFRRTFFVMVRVSWKIPTQTESKDAQHRFRPRFLCTAYGSA
ncbi:MAG: hypothetical protein L0K89_05490, partial [Bifidobacterium crudilactis]|nr:hypothetical protein [Bifidobacterium crudilactis]